MNKFPYRQFHQWFKREKRDFPWRHNPTPYQVWISEIMLQQTRASVVAGYYEKWMDRFPDIHTLAAASEEEVIKLWEGLGYYSRARNIHLAAALIVDKFGGAIPSNKADLMELKGLGEYTAGAILSFAYKQKVSAVDGNVIRVLARYFALQDDISKPATLKKIRNLADGLLPDEEPWVFNEALIELGATICSKKALCHLCPLKTGCAANIQGLASSLPVKMKKNKYERLYRVVNAIQWQDQFLIRRCPSGEIMAGLHEFPYFDTNEAGMPPEEVAAAIESGYNCSVISIDQLTEEAQSFTRYQVKLFPFLVRIEASLPEAGPEYSWVNRQDLDKLPFSSGHRKILTSIKQFLHA